MPQVRLAGPGWAPEARRRLETLIARGAGQGLPVVFDFDNTLICRDIMDVTFAEYLNDAALRKRHRIPAWMTPPFTPTGGGRPVTGEDPMAYYEALLEATRHHPTDRTAHAVAYGWTAQFLGGLSPAEVVELTRRAFAEEAGRADLRRAARPSTLPVRGTRHGAPLPFFYPEMVAL